MDLTWCFPQPEPVRVADRELRALPLRLADLARLQGFVRRAAPCPLDAARPAIRAAREGSEARRRLLRDAYLACRSWPARLGSADGQAILATESGLRFWLAVALGECNPGLSAGDVAGLADGLRERQYEHLVRVAYGASPVDELQRLIAPDCFPEGPARPTNWGKVVRSLIVETGWTFEECGRVRLPQLAAFRTDGEAGSGKLDPPPGMTRWEFARRQRKFFGPDRDEDGA